MISSKLFFVDHREPQLCNVDINFQYSEQSVIEKNPGDSNVWRFEFAVLLGLGTLETNSCNNNYLKKKKLSAVVNYQD